MTYIGAYAFANQQGLTELNLSGVQTVEQNAFTDCAALTSVDLSRVETVGKSAFSGTAPTAADPTNASRIDEKAFSGTPLTSVTFGKLEVLGAFAFSGTKLTTVTLPASFSSLYYTYVWDVLDTKGRVKETRQREVQSYGDGAFANIPTLTAITVADGSRRLNRVTACCTARLSTVPFCSSILPDGTARATPRRRARSASETAPLRASACWRRSPSLHGFRHRILRFLQIDRYALHLQQRGGAGSALLLCRSGYGQGQRSADRPV